MLRLAYLGFMGGIALFAGCAMPPIPGIHYRLDAVSLNSAGPREIVSALAAEISHTTGLAADPVYATRDGKDAFVVCDLRNKAGFGINVALYPNLHSVFLTVRDYRLHLGRDSESEERVGELAHIARKIIESQFGSSMTLWSPKQGVLGP